MGLFTRKRRTYYHDATIRAIRDPAAQELASRLTGLVDELTARVAYVENNLYEVRERLTWTSQVDGSPFTAGDAVARAIASGAPAPGLKPEPPEGA